MKKIIILAMAGSMIGPAAFAHAFLNRASPEAGSEISWSPATVDLTYTQPVEPLFSSVEVTNATGERVDEAKPITQDDGRILSVKLKPLSPGVYVVKWHVTSIDTHKTEGYFSFTVRP